MVYLLSFAHRAHFGCVAAHISQASSSASCGSTPAPVLTVEVNSSGGVSISGTSTRSMLHFLTVSLVPPSVSFFDLRAVFRDGWAVRIKGVARESAPFLRGRFLFFRGSG